MLLLQDIRESLLHFLFPRVCEGCGTDILQADHLLCLKCVTALPKTDFHFYTNNPVEKIFWGRLPVTAATAYCYFTKGSTIQHLLHQLKYRNNREAGLYLGRMMGHSLRASNRFDGTDALIPLPLNPNKERRRGYNQATLLCQGMAEVLGKPVLQHVVTRSVDTETQTKKSRVERWLNMEGKFVLSNPEAIAGKQVLLVDDVITTGATLEACGAALLQAAGTRVSIAALCFSTR